MINETHQAIAREAVYEIYRSDDYAQDIPMRHSDNIEKAVLRAIERSHEPSAQPQRSEQERLALAREALGDWRAKKLSDGAALFAISIALTPQREPTKEERDQAKIIVEQIEREPKRDQPPATDDNQERVEAAIDEIFTIGSCKVSREEFRRIINEYRATDNRLIKSLRRQLVAAELHSNAQRDSIDAMAKEIERLESLNLDTEPVPPATDDRVKEQLISDAMDNAITALGQVQKGTARQFLRSAIDKSYQMGVDSMRTGIAEGAGTSQGSHAAGQEWCEDAWEDDLGLSSRPEQWSIIKDAHNVALAAERKQSERLATIAHGYLQQLLQAQAAIAEHNRAMEEDCPDAPISIDLSSLAKHDREQWRLLIDGKRRAVCGKCGYPELVGSDDCRNCHSNFNEQIGYGEQHDAEMRKPLVDALIELRDFFADDDQGAAIITDALAKVKEGKCSS